MKINIGWKQAKNFNTVTEKKTHDKAINIIKKTCQ